MLELLATNVISNYLVLKVGMPIEFYRAWDVALLVEVGDFNRPDVVAGVDAEVERRRPRLNNRAARGEPGRGRRFGRGRNVVRADG